MKAMVKNLGLVLMLLVAPALSRSVQAVPLLQLDMLGGVYDVGTETIVAPGGAFTVYALLTPKTSSTQTQINALLSKTYYLSVALVGASIPPPPGGSLGSIQFGLPGTISTCKETSGPTPANCPQTVNVTSDMEYGTPPVEVMESMQGHDAGDLPKHGVYPTYFSEFSFKFSTAYTTSVYNTQDDPGGPSTGTGAFYAAFVGNSTLLASGYQLHFDLYDEVVRNCGTKRTSCTDVDVNNFAPFSHDAGTTPQREVPEPGTMALMGAGIAAGIGSLRRRKQLTS